MYAYTNRHQLQAYDIVVHLLGGRTHSYSVVSFLGSQVKPRVGGYYIASSRMTQCPSEASYMCCSACQADLNGFHGSSRPAIVGNPLPN